MPEDQLLRDEIEVDPFRPGPANVRLRRSGVHVWAVIGYYLHAVDGDADAVAEDYKLHPVEVEAALIYYHRHQAEIEGRLADNEPSAVR